MVATSDDTCFMTDLKKLQGRPPTPWLHVFINDYYLSATKAPELAINCFK